MAGFEFDWESALDTETVLCGLQSRAVYEAFVKEQEAESYEIDIDAAAGTAEARWVVELPSDVPGIVKRLVGNPLRLKVHIETNAGGQRRFDLDAVGKRRGELRSAMTIEPQSLGCLIHLRGSVGVSGLGGSQAASTARDQVIKPVLREDFFPMLEKWGRSSDGP